MNVWINFTLNGEEQAWSTRSGRNLVLINKTGQTGSLVRGINLGYFRKGRTSFIFLNVPKFRPSSKTVGIFCWPDSYEIEGSSRFLGVSKDKTGDVVGMFGIYDIGTIIKTREGSEWELTQDGWIQKVVG